jgi:hypothetical protein
MGWRQAGKFGLYTAGAIGGVVFGLGAAGYCLPAAQEAGRSLTLNRSNSEVWDTLTDYSSHPKWRKSVVRVERLNDLHGNPVWKEWPQRGRALPRRLVRRIVDGEAPYSGSWTIELTPYGRGSLITITEKSRVPNPYHRLFSRIGDPNASIDSFLMELAARFGERPRIGEKVVLL